MSGNLSHSMRANYNQHGVEGYYNIVSESYRNPHYLGLKKVLNSFMDRFIQQERPIKVDVLDLAAGSGEATEVLLEWKATKWPKPAPPPPMPSLTDQAAPPTQRTGVPAPPRPFVPRPAMSRPRTVSKNPPIPEPRMRIVAADPYTAPAYKQRLGLECLPLSFADVAAGDLPTPSGEPYQTEESEACDVQQKHDSTVQDDVFDLVVVSFALHLVESSSELWALLTTLATRAKWLIVIAPHKKPDIKDSWGWTRWDPSPKWKAAEGRGNVGGSDGDGFEIVLDRVRLRVWRSEHYRTRNDS
ncbi:hypothetical protein OIO90_004043 [Microbotryomycetes sp. JL221]|nr:hypothetical protein OIO90_004043 [Microbotryomycetes sp. JL221]